MSLQQEIKGRGQSEMLCFLPVALSSVGCIPCPDRQPSPHSVPSPLLEVQPFLSPWGLHTRKTSSATRSRVLQYILRFPTSYSQLCKWSLYYTLHKLYNYVTYFLSVPRQIQALIQKVIEETWVSSNLWLHRLESPLTLGNWWRSIFRISSLNSMATPS